MKLKQVIILGLSLAFLIIGIDQTITLGFAKAYWAFMISLLTFFVYNLGKPGAQSRTEKPGNKK